MSVSFATTADPDPLKITHVIGCLEVGGAQQALYNLLARIDPAQATMNVVSLIPGGAMTEPIQALGARVEHLDMRAGRPDPRGLLRLAAILRRDRPDLVVTWMYHANLLGGLATRLVGRMPLIWSIRNTSLHPKHAKLLTRWTARVGGLLSRLLPDRVVFVANASRESHLASGYARENSLVIPNGFDLERFRPRTAARASLRQELRVSPHSELVGVIGRFHPDKDHRTFLQAAAMLHRQRPSTRFVLCGEGMTPGNELLRSWARQFGVDQACHWLGLQSDVPRIASALDVAVCSSVTEAFPQAIGEAMACAIPCVVTDVGDAAELVAGTGKVVAPGDPAGLSRACGELLALEAAERAALGAAARQRILDCYTLEAIVPRHWAVWNELLTQHVGRERTLAPAHA